MSQELQIPDFRKIAEEALKRLPAEAGAHARAFFLESFIKQGFTDTSFIAWPNRKDTDSHKMLSQSLALRGSIRVSRADMQRVEVNAGEGLPYAGIHNNGGVISVRVTDRLRRFCWYMYKKTEQDKWKWMALTKKETLSIRIPKRQFIGNSHTLSKELDMIFIQRIIEAQKNLKF